MAPGCLLLRYLANSSLREKSLREKRFPRSVFTHSQKRTRLSRVPVIHWRGLSPKHSADYFLMSLAILRNMSRLVSTLRRSALASFLTAG